MGNYFTLKKNNNENNLLSTQITSENDKYILENQNVKDAIKIIEKFNKLYQTYKKYIELIINDKSNNSSKIHPNNDLSENLSNKISLLLISCDINIEENINNTLFSITKKKYILQNIELRLYNLLFEYDFIMCNLNTIYNKNVNKKNNSSANIKKIIDYIVNLKNKEITPKILEIGDFNQFIEASMRK